MKNTLKIFLLSLLFFVFLDINIYAINYNKFLHANNNKLSKILNISNNEFFSIKYFNVLKDSQKNKIKNIVFSLKKQNIKFLMPEENLQLDLLEDLYSNYLKIPNNIKVDFINEGWQIFIIKDYLGQKIHNDNRKIIGACIFDKKEIYLEFREGISEAIIHEIGHYVDYTLNNISYGRIFSTCYINEKEDFSKIHYTNASNINSRTEYFAEFFQEFILNKSLIKECKETFNFFNNLINSFSEMNTDDFVFYEF